jgi:uncharacterized phiE125 gp8 family phage protein
MILVETSSTGVLPVTLEQAQSQLACLGSDHTARIDLLIAAATDWAERFSQRTLRVSVTRTLSLCDWWDDPLVLPWPPIASVTSVKYSDADNVEQTLTSTYYRLLTDTYGTGRIEWTPTAVLPTLYDRGDAIRVLFVTGVAAASVPAVAKQAILLKIEELWGQGDGRDLDRYGKCAADLLGLVDWPRYA